MINAALTYMTSLTHRLSGTCFKGVVNPARTHVYRSIYIAPDNEFFLTIILRILWSNIWKNSFNTKSTLQAYEWHAYYVGYIGTVHLEHNGFSPALPFFKKIRFWNIILTAKVLLGGSGSESRIACPSRQRFIFHISHAWYAVADKKVRLSAIVFI
jgi:hypothetical protein